MGELAISAHGTLLQIGDGGGTEVFTNVAEVVDINGLGFKRSTNDASDQTSVWGTHTVGMIKCEPYTFTLHFVPTDDTQDAQVGLIKDMVDGTLRNFRHVFPDVGNTTWAFSAHVVEFKPKSPNEGNLDADVTLEIQGAPTLA